VKKFLLLVICTALLVGCEVSPQWRAASTNYAIDKCEGKLLGDVTTRVVDTADLDMMFGWNCITKQGVVYQSFKYRDIPLEYWEGVEE
jgi:hypothetical protein